MATKAKALLNRLRNKKSFQLNPTPRRSKFLEDILVEKPKEDVDPLTYFDTIKAQPKIRKAETYRHSFQITEPSKFNLLKDSLKETDENIKLEKKKKREEFLRNRRLYITEKENYSSINLTNISLINADAFRRRPSQPSSKQISKAHTLKRAKSRLENNTETKQLSEKISKISQELSKKNMPAPLKKQLTTILNRKIIPSQCIIDRETQIIEENLQEISPVVPVKKLTISDIRYFMQKN